ncbi:type II toxin-antitoxin system RnlB family antitoxin [Sporosarcina sp. 179-K 8C2 HS]|uniref:type II toxin-antitoxin system RnlB family antitoxin n=1 Tax=Sporosarcina sp. 179-K 8C2 HS TaxID=3142387 RepID=UPI0039A339F2
MDNFDVIQLNNAPYDYLLIATSFRSSLSDLAKLNSVVRIGQGKVLFDFMLIHGNKKNRFVECSVVDDSCERQTIKIAEQVDDEIRKKSSLYFRENEELVKNSVLPKALQYLITTGDVI